MKHLSYWAKHHPLAARAIIVTAHTIAAIFAFKTGLWLYARYDVAWPVWLFPVLLLLTVWVKSAYPTQPPAETTAADQHYWRSRRVLVGMTLCAWLFVLLAGNRTAQWSEQPLENSLSGTPDSATSTTERGPAAYGQVPFLMTDGGKSMHIKTTFKWLKIKKKTWVEKKVQRIRQRSAHAGREGLDVAVQVLLTLLLIAVSMVLVTLVAALSCELSCSGQEGLALVVLLVGGGLIIWGLVAGMIAIWKKRGDGDFPPPPGDPVPRRPPSKKL